MTPTYTPTVALAMARKYARDVPITDIDSQMVDIVNSIIWTYHPWRWARAALTAITLTDGVQDFAVAAGNSNLFKLLQVRITRTDTTPDQYHDLTVRDFLAPDLSPTSMFGIQSAAYDPITDKIRLSQAISVGSGETLTINGEYWKEPTKITDANVGTAFLFPDLHLPVMLEGLKWQLFQYSNDQRAGAAQVNRQGQLVYTGQYGIFMSLLEAQAMAEDYGDEGSEFPDSPIGNRDSWMSGIYG